VFKKILLLFFDHTKFYCHHELHSFCAEPFVVFYTLTFFSFGGMEFYSLMWHKEKESTLVGSCQHHKKKEKNLFSATPA
jgi:hypothetical protein